MPSQVLLKVQKRTEFFKDSECRVLHRSTTAAYEAPKEKILSVSLMGRKLHGVKIKNIGWVRAADLQVLVPTHVVLDVINEHTSEKLTVDEIPVSWRGK
jgi:hypothetical protein